MNNLSLKYQRELAEAQAKLSALEFYQDVEEVKDIWGQYRLCSQTVTNTAEKFELKAKCDCCKGATVFLLPYVEHECIRIYSKPYYISFGKKFGNKIVSNDDWEGDEAWDYFSGILLENVFKWLGENEVDFDDAEEWA